MRQFRPSPSTSPSPGSAASLADEFLTAFGRDAPLAAIRQLVARLAAGDAAEADRLAEAILIIEQTLTNREPKQ